MKKVEGFEYYFITECGEIYSFHPCHKLPMELKQQTIELGYKTIRLRKNKKYHTCRIHRLLAKAFIPNPENKPIINHKDNDPSNNSLNNLEWCTYKYNVHYSIEQGRFRNGSKAYNSLLKEEFIPKIIKLSKKGISNKNIGKMFGVHRKTIYDILNGKTWKHLTKNLI